MIKRKWRCDGYSLPKCKKDKSKFVIDVKVSFSVTANDFTEKK